MTRLGESVARARTLLSADLSSDATVRELLQETGVLQCDCDLSKRRHK